ncbi:MAG: hypothetical protein U9N85_04640 [Bacteroidota bacterium]|nr:hypothetical protein [Bacteroidota bacterium]
MKYYILTIVAIFTTQILFAQYDVDAKKGTESFKKIGSKEVISVKIYDQNAEEIQKAWRNMMRWKHRVLKIETAQDLYADNAKMEMISDNTVDIYGKLIINAGGYMEFKVAVDLGGAFLKKSSHPKKYAAMLKFMEDFAVEESKKGLEKRILAEQDKMEALKKENHGFRQDIAGYKKEIAEYEQKIVDAKNNIEREKRLITGKDAEISKQEKELQRLRSVTIKK